MSLSNTSLLPSPMDAMNQKHSFGAKSHEIGIAIYSESGGYTVLQICIIYGRSKRTKIFTLMCTPYSTSDQQRLELRILSSLIKFCTLRGKVNGYMVTQIINDHIPDQHQLHYSIS